MTLYFPPIPSPPLFSLRPEAVKREVKSKGGLSFAHTPTCFTFTLLLSPLFPHHTFLFPLDLCCLHTFNYFFDIQSFCIPLSCSTKFTSLAERLYPGALTMDTDAFKVKQRHRSEKLARLLHCTTAPLIFLFFHLHLLFLCAQILLPFIFVVFLLLIFVLCIQILFDFTDVFLNLCLRIVHSGM